MIPFAVLVVRDGLGCCTSSENPPTSREAQRSKNRRYTRITRHAQPDAIGGVRGRPVLHHLWLDEEVLLVHGKEIPSLVGFAPLVTGQEP